MQNLVTQETKESSTTKIAISANNIHKCWKLLGSARLKLAQGVTSIDLFTVFVYLDVLLMHPFGTTHAGELVGSDFY